MKILVIENSPVVCERLLALLADSGDYETFGCAASVATALALIKTRRPDTLLLDLHLDDGSGFQVLEKLRDDGVATPTIVISECDEPQYRQRAQALGAAAYLHKSTQFEDIVPTLRRIQGARASQSSPRTSP